MIVKRKELLALNWVEDTENIFYKKTSQCIVSSKSYAHINQRHKKNLLYIIMKICKKKKKKKKIASDLHSYGRVYLSNLFIP